MGVPAFYRWLSEKYPKTIVEMLEKRMAVVDGVAIPLNLVEENPNGIEYDNLYIDMNGLIHPCSHPEDREAPTSEEEMYVNVTKYIDRLIAAVRPRRILFLAIDGVAPRAKMNQQRSRRFRAARDAKEQKIALEEVIADMKALGHPVPPDNGHSWDSNVITPGTEFMAKLSDYIWFYILDRINKDSLWKTIKVIFSDASEPGEGEHKIMHFIRAQRSQPGFCPNQRHILHGLDADLIMLALATHEAHFTILREQVTFNKRDREKPKISDAQQLLNAEFNKSSAAVSALNPADEWIYAKPLQCLHINILREYLYYEFKCLQDTLPFPFDLERTIDDFVFMCFFVGNDFLPHLPSLDIRDGAIDFLLQVYKEILPALGDYLTSPGGNVNLSKVDVILGRVGEIEDEVFRRRRIAEEVEQQRKKIYKAKDKISRGALTAEQRKPGYIPPPVFSTESNTSLQQPVRSYSTSQIDMKYNGPGQRQTELSTQLVSKPNSTSNMEAAAMLKKSIFSMHKPAPAAAPDSRKRVAEEALQSSEDAEWEDAGGGGSSGGGSRPVTKVPRSSREAKGGSLTLDAVKKEETAMRSDPKIIAVSTETIAESKTDFNTSTINDDNMVVDTTTTTTTTTTLVPEEEDDDDVDNHMEADIEEEEEDEELFPPSMNLTIPIPIPIEILPTTSHLSGAELLAAKNQLKNRLKDKQSEKLDHLYEESTKGSLDAVRLHEEGWKTRYYEDRFKKQDIAEGGGLDRMCKTYVEGLCWVLKYYYEGCISWNWYYPFHYSPFASDLRNIDKYDIKFTKSKPFHPLEQLLAVLPSESAHALPPSVRWLMLDPKTSPIYDLYQSDAPIDPNGKHLPWLWVLLLPFVDESRITAALKLCEDRMTPEDRILNSWGDPLLFFHANHPLALAMSQYEELGIPTRIGEGGGDDRSLEPFIPLSSHDEAMVVKIENNVNILDTPQNSITSSSITSNLIEEKSNIDGNISTSKYTFMASEGDGLAGSVQRCSSSHRSCPLATTIPAPQEPPGVYFPIKLNKGICLTFHFPPEGKHLSQLLPGVQLGPSVLTPSDVISRRSPRLNRGFNLSDLNQTQGNRGSGRGYGQENDYSHGRNNNRGNAAGRDNYLGDRERPVDGRGTSSSSYQSWNRQDSTATSYNSSQYGSRGQERYEMGLEASSRMINRNLTPHPSPSPSLPLWNPQSFNPPSVIPAAAPTRAYGQQYPPSYSSSSGGGGGSTRSSYEGSYDRYPNVHGRFPPTVPLAGIPPPHSISPYTSQPAWLGIPSRNPVGHALGATLPQTSMTLSMHDMQSQLARTVAMMRQSGAGTAPPGPRGPPSFGAGQSHPQSFPRQSYPGRGASNNYYGGRGSGSNSSGGGGRTSQHRY